MFTSTQFWHWYRQVKMDIDEFTRRKASFELACIKQRFFDEISA